MGIGAIGPLCNSVLDIRVHVLVYYTDTKVYEILTVACVLFQFKYNHRPVSSYLGVQEIKIT